ncbi:MAG: hypothetical protein SF182_04340 [Deltaproteobacteria bacterium]|nr:hypothetical protein [Deltaproteobacteria bacterium]
MQEFPVQVGSMLFTMVDPHVGHEVAYNRWYERDHFYAGCMVGPWLFAGRRWVAPKRLKEKRFPADSTIARPSVQAGSYVATYWIHAGHHDEHHQWAGEQARWLYQNQRGFDARTHVHTLMYTLAWCRYRDADPVPLALSLDHPFAGMATVFVERNEGVDAARFDAWFRDQHLPGALAGSPLASCSRWAPIPQREGPMTIPRVERPERLDLYLFFPDTPAEQCWERFEQLQRDIDASGLGRVVFASPWLPTVVGTDRYTDELW